MGTRGPISWTALGCWVCMLHAWADPGPTSADGRLTPADEFAPGVGFPTAAERGLLRATGPAVTETAVTLATQSPPALSAVAAGADVTMLPGEIAISSGRAGNTGASFPAEVATASLVSAGNGAIANSVPEPASSLPEPGAGGGEAAEIPTEEADTSAGTTNSLDVSPAHRTVATAPAGDAAATSAVFYSSPSGPRPTLFSRSELEVTRSGPGTFSGVTASSPLSAATGNGRTTPGGPGALTSTGTAVSKGTPLSPSAFLSPAALAGETPPPAFVAGVREAGSPGPAETEGEGHPPSGVSSITGLPHLASANETVTGPATPEGRGAMGEPVLAAHEETPKSAIDTQSQTNPSPTDTERRLANTEELPTGEPGASSNAKTSPRSFREPGTVTARPTLSGGTAPSASPSPRDTPAEPSHSETDSTGSALAGVSGAPSSPRPSPDAAVGTAPVAPGEGEELTNSAPGPPLSPSARESASPAAAAKGPAGVNVPGDFASAGLAANSAANEAATTSHAGTQSDTDPSPWRAQPSPAPTGELPTGDPGALVMDSPPPSSARETAVSPAPSGNGGDTASPVSAAHGATPISDPNLQSVTNPSPSVPEPHPGDTAGNTAAWANAEASPSPPLGDGTGTGRLAPSGGTSPPALASPSRAPAESETTGEATPGLSGALQAPRPAPAREPSTATEGTPASVFAGPGDAAFLPSVSHSPGGPSAVGSAPPSSAGERVPVTPVAMDRSGGAAGSVPAANKEPTISNPNAQHAGVSPASGAELPPGERGTLAKAETSPGSSLGDGNTTGLHAPSGETSPAAFASPGETAAGPSASETARPGPSLPSAPVPSPASPKRPTVIGPAGVTKEAAISGVPPAVPGLEAGTGQSPTTPRLATSCTPSAPGSHSPALHSEKGETPPERGANLDWAGASRVPAAATPAPSRGRAETPSPLLGTTALQSDTRAGSDQARTAAVSVGIREATRTGTGQSATVAAVPLYPYGEKETDTRYVERRVDFNSPVFRPEIGFPVGKTLHDSLYFTDNGQIIFPASDSDTFPSPNPPPGGFTGREKVPMVAVFWANADFSKGVGTTFYQEFVTLDSAEHPFVRDVEDKIRRYLKTSYSAKWTLKITWEKAPAYPARPPVTRTNTYQAVLTTDGFKAYALLLYQDGGMQWDYTKLGLTNVLMGYSSGDGLYRNDDLTQRPPAAKYRPDQFRGYNTDLRGLWLYSLASHVQVNYRLRCLAWLSSQQDPAGWNEDLPACPCSLRRGALDRHYRRSRGSADARVTMLYPASPNRYGAGVRCLYDSQNELVDGRQERTWKDSRQASPDRDAELKFHDWCCRQAGSPQLCAKYAQKRPKISCAGYTLPNQSTSSEEAERDSEEGRE